MIDPSSDYQHWLALAHSDLAVAQKLLEGPELYPLQSCFFAQQAAEKAIKGALVRHVLLEIREDVS